MNIYVGNLSYRLTDVELSALFQDFGPVTSANIIKDKYSGQSKGFGFVEMENDDDAKRALEALNGKEFQGREIVVNEARPRKEFSGGGGSGGGGGRRGGGGGGGDRGYGGGGGGYGDGGGRGW
jgi:RNA recognition motif-containing protein